MYIYIYTHNNNTTYKQNYDGETRLYVMQFDCVPPGQQQPTLVCVYVCMCAYVLYIYIYVYIDYLHVCICVYNIYLHICMCAHQITLRWHTHVCICANVYACV